MIGAMKRKASLSLSESSTNNNTHNTHTNNNNGHPKQEKRIRWDGPRTQSLIDHYRNYEFLWNPKLADYKNDKKRTSSLEGWLEQNNFDRDLVNEVKMKLHGLRTSFGHQLKLEYSSSTSDQEKERGEETGPFVSKWQWYNQLSFLKETMTFRSASSNNNNNISPADSPPSSVDHSGHHVIHNHSTNQHHLVLEDPENVKIELSSSNTPLNMQVMSHYSVQQQQQQPHEIQSDYIMQSHHHSHSQPHNLTVSGVPISVQLHDNHPSILPHSRKEEEDSLSYHHVRISATPPMAHMQSLTSQHNQQQQPTLAHSTPDISRYQSGCCSCNCSERPRLTIGEKLGRLVEETFNNLHPEYQEMARIEIQQVLGKYLQKPIP